mgnify:CR=1 FL=1
MTATLDPTPAPVGRPRDSRIDAEAAAAFTDVDILRELEPLVAREVDRHIAKHKDWHPHDYVPWAQGRNFPMLGGEAWEVGQSQLTEEIRTALVVNLLTEDNLPSYHHEIATIFRGQGAWGEWVHRWTAEEGRHSVAMRDYLIVTRAVDPEALERARMVHMSTGFASDHGDQLLHGLAYVSFQELATRVAHRNTGHLSNEPLCDQLMQRIALDENLHMLFYRNVLAGAMDLAPDQTLAAVYDVVTKFQMPGHSIDGFARKSLQMALVGVYDARQHLDDVLMPILRQWKVFERTDFSPAGEATRENLAEFLAELEAQAAKFEQMRDARNERRARKAEASN